MYIPECYFMRFALYGCTHWRLGVIMAPALWLLAAPEVVMMTPSGVGWWQDRWCGGPQSSVKSGCGVNLPTHVCYMLPCMCMYVCMFIDNKTKQKKTKKTGETGMSCSMCKTCLWKLFGLRKQHIFTWIKEQARINWLLQKTLILALLRCCTSYSLALNLLHKNVAYPSLTHCLWHSHTNISHQAIDMIY